MAVAQSSISAIPARISNMDPNFDRPSSTLARGVQITEFKDTSVNPEPVVLEETEILLEQYLSPRKLKLLTGSDNLDEVTSLDLKVDTTETSLGNFGSLLPNLTQLKMSESVVHSIRDIGSSLRGVRVLWMSQCGLYEVDGISSMTSLQELYLPYNEISDISTLSMLDDLQILDIEGNNIDDIAQMQYLALCQNLTRLTIEGNPVCVMRKPDSEEVNYNYREVVKNILPNVEILDDEPLITGSQPSMSLNAFDKDWEYLEELQHDALLQSPTDEDDKEINVGSRPGTAALKPATAYRPGSALRPSSGFRPISASTKRPATISGRPSTSIRPTTAFAERPASSDAAETTTDGASDLTLGNVICGNPSRALRERRKITPKTPDQDDFSFNTPRNTEKTSNKSIDEEEESKTNIVEELKEWRKDHNNRMVKLQETKTAEVLVIDHHDDNEDSSAEDDYIEMTKSIKTDNLTTQKTLNHSKNYGRGDKHDEVHDIDYEINEDVLKKHRPASPSRRSNSSGYNRNEDKQKPVLNQKHDFRFPYESSGISIPVVKTPPEKLMPPIVPRSASSRAVLPTPPRIRRQLPQVPSLPSKPSSPKS
ncbi:hypothetical protein SNE40_003221 [Patella caerulea]|uniref:Leucine-rich repeat-containing protein 56 n=1 Tax=Patella caerulea TaxID=87958 RepID=A0AAN8K7E9_PATCE